MNITQGSYIGINVNMPYLMAAITENYNK